MKVSQLGKIVLILLIPTVSLNAQMNRSVRSQESIKIKDNRQGEKTTASSSGVSLQTKTSSHRVLSFFKQKRNKEQQRQLLPKIEDVNRFAAFLQQPKTGIIRLIEDIGCEPSRYVIRADEECLKSIPGGSFYSFREREYSSSALADIRLKDGLLISDGFFSQNILVKLGDVSLENISINSDGMKFLTEFTPETNVKAATAQYIKITKGVKVGKYEYIKVFPAIENATYAMRLVAYRAKIARVYRGFVYNPLAGDDRSDIILAFRVVKADNEGITLLWKELERKKAPKIEISR